MARKIVAGNWKMNKSLAEARVLFNEIGKRSALCPVDVELVVCPPALYLQELVTTAANFRVEIGAQNCAQWEAGAYTGEISAAMLQSAGVKYCIVGHSERRQFFAESNEQIKQKAEVLLTAEVTPILCCGESLAQRESGQHFDFIKQQIEESLWHLPTARLATIIIAYEPIWAIGTGITANPEQAQEVHAFLRSLLRAKAGKEIANQIPLLYGGSCKPSNASELFSQPDIDGGLIGGASLQAEDFIGIAQSW